LRVQALRKKLIAAQRLTIELESVEREIEAQQEELVQKANTTSRRLELLEKMIAVQKRRDDLQARAVLTNAGPPQLQQPPMLPQQTAGLEQLHDLSTGVDGSYLTSGANQGQTKAYFNTSTRGPETTGCTVLVF
jgi:hypothetical protein